MGKKREKLLIKKSRGLLFNDSPLLQEL